MLKVKKGQSRHKLVLGPRRSQRIRADLPRTSPAERNDSQQRFANAALSLPDLPEEILHKIIGNINIWHHNRIRATCKRLKDVSDAFIMHEFRKALARHVSEDPYSHQSAVLKGIEQATEVYVRSGFQSVFCGCLLPLLRISYRDPFSPQHPYISKCLLNFFQMVESTIGDSTQSSRFLYTLTLIRFLKAFKSITVVSTCTLPEYWMTVIELKGPWMGIVASRSQSQNLSSKQNHLLVTLAELLIGDISNQAFKRVWECDNEVYVYGNDTSCTEKRVPRTIFTITIHGSKKISTLLSKCLYDDPKEFVWMEKWPRDQFTVNVDTCCKEATKWGCLTSYHLVLSPFENQTFSDEDIISIESS